MERENAEKLRRQVSALAKFGGQALRSRDISELLQEATRLVSDAMDIDLVKVLQLLPDGQNLLVRAGVNWQPGIVGHATIPAHEGSAAGYALRANEPVISEDTSEEKRFHIPELLFEHCVRSTVNVVIRGERGPFGVLEVDAQRLRRFGQDDIDFLQNYANLLAAAIDRMNVERELTESAQRQNVLAHELQHRINNMLAMIRAVARRARSSYTTVDEFVEAFDNRLAAIARVHNLLARPEEAAISVRAILMQELTAYGAIEGENFAQRGTDTVLPSKQAEALSMAFHELATNAIKHGGLSVKNGRIDVSWDTDASGREKQVRIRWRESGVRIEDVPAVRGFGSEILEKSVPVMLGGTLERIFHPDGTECVIEFPIEK